MGAQSQKNQLTQSDVRRDLSNPTVWQVRSNLWQPPTDIYELEDSFIVKVEIAGLRIDDLEMAVQKNILYIGGVRSDTPERKAYRQMEIPFGRFSVNIELSFRVVVEESFVEYKDGFLTIRLPKEK